MSLQTAEKAPPGVEEFVVGVETRLGELLEQTPEVQLRGGEIIAEASRHLTLASAAKRARPRLVYHFGRALSSSVDELVDIAAAAELVHTASLLHDDVIDAGEERRERSTVNTQWDNITAVLSGDALLCEALERLAGYPTSLTRTAVGVVAEMTRGIMHEVTARRRVDLTREDWWSVASGKTGALFGWCGSAVAQLMGAQELVERFESCGRRLGVAFQLADDLKDLIPYDSGKDRWADIRNGNPSYPLICAVDEAPEIGRSLQAHWEDERGAQSADEIGEAVVETSAVEQTRRLVAREVDGALSALGEYAEEPGGRRIALWARRLCEEV